MRSMKQLAYAIIALCILATAYAIYRAGQLSDARQEAETLFHVEQQARQATEKALSSANHQLIQIAAQKASGKELSKYVKNDRSCNLSVGAAGLLDQARTGVPATAAGTDAESRTDSGITQTSELEDHAALAFQYRELAARHDALITWLVDAR